MSYRQMNRGVRDLLLRDGMVESDRRQFRPADVRERAAQLKVLPNQVCCMCLIKIETMTFQNTGVCSEQHRKDRDNDHEVTRVTTT